MNRRTRVAASAAVALAAAGCTSSGANAASVRMTGTHHFEPAVVEVPVGGRVSWQNDGVTQHTATAIDGARAPSGEFDSGVVVGTGTFTHTFERTGSITYQCMIHGSEMVGVVTVVQR